MGTSVAFACRCQSASLRTYYNRADVVVVAKVSSVSTDARQMTTAKLAVSNVWKKDMTGQIEAITGSSCAFDFKEDGEYLVYLRATPDGKMSTMQCQGNLPFNRAGKAKTWLKRYGKIGIAASGSFVGDNFFVPGYTDLFWANTFGNVIR
ncbi:MAG: hypothetical protein H7070_12620 [Saprospiraceae bacterium]|nr:hypothetical protein [Pyrinomonadaceae bacterium]